MMELAQFDPLVNTNYIPTDEEVLRIQAFLAEPLRKLGVLEDGISAAELHVRNLRQEREDLLQQIDKYRTLTSPVRRLPPDVLREIFIACLPDDRNPTMGCDEAPVVLTRVCASWRSIAMNEARLWAALHIPVPRSGPVFDASYDLTTGERITVMEVLDTRLAAVREWIKRSGSLPLSFSLHEHDVYPPSDYAGLFLRCISDYRMRWKSISLVCAATSFSKIREIPPSEVPLLETLSLLLSRPDSANTKVLKWKDSPIFSASRIRSVSLCSLNAPIFEFPFRWSQLTHFCIKSDQWSTIAETTIDDIISILDNCSNLVSCDIRLGHGSNPHHRTMFPLISLPHLESLKIYDTIQVAAFFSSLVIPNLRKLEYLAYENSMVAAGSSAFYSLLTAVGKTLEELAVTPGPLEIDDPVQLLRLCPSLKSFSITSSSLVPPTSHTDTKPATISSSFLKILDNVPNLENFECHTVAHFSDEALLEFILRKQSGGNAQLKPLKSVYVLFRRRPTIDIPSILSPQVLGGLKLEIKYPPRTYRGPFSLYDGLPPAVKRDPYSYFQSPF
ncbi:hypothetical protein BJ912DRAFT_1148157 [Pholiota molesta]|nr:hypothetical protein BJ912DRAFT_1148157 [Pholiota molesta]